MTKLSLQPIPYQGSKRSIAQQIFSLVPGKVSRIVEPFAGSAAVTLYAARQKIADTFIVNDSYQPLINLWERMVNDPHGIAQEYENIWAGQMDDSKSHYAQIRSAFNQDQDPAKFLYLVSRCVKNAIRFNSKGEFNQGADNRRLGRRPSETRRQIVLSSLMLRGKVEFYCEDFMDTLARAKPGDLVYMDPPYQGTSTKTNPRYHQGLTVEKLIEGLMYLNERKISFLLSYDGSCGEKQYGIKLPEDLGLERIEINAGRSSQATLQGKDEKTIESLYVSPSFSSNLDLI